MRSFAFIIFALCAVEAMAASYNIVPEPQLIVNKAFSSYIHIDESWTILVDAASPSPRFYPSDTNPYMFCAQELQRELKRILKCELRIQKISPATSMRRSIILGNPLHDPHVGSVSKFKGVDVQELPFEEHDSRYDEGYILDTNPEVGVGENVLIAARGPAGVYYGTRTFLRLIDHEGQVAGVRVIDFPDMKWRGVCYGPILPVSEENMVRPDCLSGLAVDELLREVEKISDLKMNTAIFMGKAFHSLDKGNRHHLRRLFRECRLRFVTPIPTILTRVAGFLYSEREQSCTPLFHPEEQQGVRIQDEPFVFNDSGLAEAEIKPTSAILNGSFENHDNGLPSNWTFDGFGLFDHWGVVRNIEHKNMERFVYAGDFGVRLISKGHYRNVPMRFLASLIPHSDGPGSFLNVLPRSYYELTFWDRTSGKHGENKLLLSVIQLDGRNQVIKEGATYAQKFPLFPKWTNHHHPIFTHRRCKKLQLVFRMDPKSKGGDIYLDDFTLVRMNGRLANVMQTSQTDIIVSSVDKRHVFQKGVDYTIKTGLFFEEAPYDWKSFQGAEIRLKKGSAIVKNTQVLVSYDCHILNPRGEEARRSPSVPATYERYRRLFSSLMELDPRYILVGLDEFRGGLNRDSRCLRRHLTNAELFASMVNSINDILRQRGPVEVLPGYKVTGLGRPDVRLIIWDDMVNYRHNGGQERGEYYQVRYGGIPGSTYLSLPGTPLPEDAFNRKGKRSLKTISRDVIIASWWYNRDRRGVIKHSPDYYDKRGYDFLVCPWYRKENVLDWARSVEGKKALGIIDTTFGNKMAGIPFSADYAWKSVGKREW